MNTATAERPTKRQKRATVESARRVSAHEAQHIGAEVVAVPIARSRAAKPYALCPMCDRRALYLYQSGAAWMCRACANLTYAAQQHRGTREAFAQWLTPARWEWASSKHPAQHELYERMAEIWREQCAPFQWEKLTDAERAELLQFYASPEAVARVFNSQRAKWSAEVETLAQAAGEEIARDLWAWWKDKQRRPKRAKGY